MISYTLDNLLSAVSAKLGGRHVTAERLTTYRGTVQRYQIRDGGARSIEFDFGSLHLEEPQEMGRYKVSGLVVERSDSSEGRVIQLDAAVDLICQSAWERSLY